ncbi:MAG TPA: 4Fe-4S dicluster domain-containing protein [Chthoniobacteraceae bacterium]|jgi:NADH-quinone oxidoreductase subunit I|nr:4Fe-4S dicluster domain-containing protein [Chthoniobacteraceae bacterium]
MIGAGIIRGMAVTARNLIGSYFEPERLTTVQYPEERDKIAENYRNFPFLVYDGDDPETGLRCTSCKICEKECPPQVIFIIQDRDEKGKPLKRPKVFDIDTSACMSCQICVEVCPFESIKMDKAFEVSNRDRFGALVLHKSGLAKANAYYHQIRPSEADAVDAALAEAAARKKAKAP